MKSGYKKDYLFIQLRSSVANYLNWEDQYCYHLILLKAVGLKTGLAADTVNCWQRGQQNIYSSRMQENLPGGKTGWWNVSSKRRKKKRWQARVNSTIGGWWWWWGWLTKLTWREWGGCSCPAGRILTPCLATGCPAASSSRMTKSFS